ncbi:MAG: osmoprotectant NAGGN system M42 family peptidase [Alphaproteobacteria bacterium]|nr:osmoprotectant NAGGN system M42 family peptidase [Alphaproteobacteria bacterium]
MNRILIDMDYAIDILVRLLRTPSPTGYTDKIVHMVVEELQALGLEPELTRRGAIRAEIKGKQSSPDRAIVSHLDTLGAQVKRLKPNGRLEIFPIGHWSARFAEGARVSVFTRDRSVRGTILPLKASGHTYNEEIDTQPVAWTNLEVRLDEQAWNAEAVADIGIAIGDFISIDTGVEVGELSGFINSRHLDDKAGVAAMLAAAKAVVENGLELPVDTYLLFTISEEIGSGASAILHGDISEMVSVDNGTVAPGQASLETGVTIAMADMVGPFDYHLTNKLIDLCADFDVPFQRDIFRYYRSDSASAIEAGSDIRTALVCVGVDASHGYERTHTNAILSVAQLLTLYMQSPPTAKRDAQTLGDIEGFTEQPTEEIIASFGKHD